jgi:hypothetical protein
VRGLEVVAAGEDGEEAGRVLGRLRRGVERPVVGQHLRPDGEDLALARGRDLALHDVVAGERGAHQVLGPVLDPLDRLAGDDRADDGADVAGVDADLVAEAAADVAGEDPDLVLGDARDHGVERPVGVRRLRRLVQGQLAVDRVVVGDRAAGLHGRWVHPRVDDLLADDDVRAGEDGVGLGRVARLPVEDVVVGLPLVVADDGRIRVECPAGVDDRGQVLVLDVDELEGVAGGVAVLGDDEGDLLALEAHLVGGQHGHGVGRQGRCPGEVESLEVLAGDDGEHLRVREGLGGVDGDDPGVRQRRAQDRAVQHPGQHDVVEVAALAADEPRILLALDAAVPDRPVDRAGRRVGLPLLRHRRAFLDRRHTGTSWSVTVAAASRSAGWAAAHWTERTIVA